MIPTTIRLIWVMIFSLAAASVLGRGNGVCEKIYAENLAGGIHGVVRNARTGELIKGAEVRLMETATGRVIQFITAPGGEFDIELPDYPSLSIQIKAVGFIPLKEELMASEGREQVFEMQPIELGKAVTLKNIYYDIGALEPRDDAWPELEKLSEMLRQNPGLRIEIQSHTDSRGDDAANLALSQQRAEAIRDVLVQMGVASSRVRPVGYGEQQLLNPCKNGISCAEEFHQQNRRTVFLLSGENDERIVSADVPLMDLQPDFSSGGYSLSEFLEDASVSPAKVPTTSGTRYSILLGTYPQKPADAFFEPLKEYENAIFEEKQPGGISIRVGNVTSQEVAERHLDRLRRKGFSDAKIITLGEPIQPIATSEPAGHSVSEGQQASVRTYGNAEPAEGNTSSKADLTVRARTFRHGFLVQVGAFPGNPGPEFYNQLGDYRYKVVTEVKGNLVRYRIGPYVTREEAENARLDLVKKGFRDAFLVE